MAQALYREWFVNFRFPGHAKVKRVASALGPVPQGWQPGTLGDFAGEQRRAINPDEVEPDTPYIGLEHMPRKSIALGEWGCAKEVQSTKLLFKKGDILFGKIRPYFHKVGVAAVDGVCSTDAIVIAPKNPDHFALVLACVSSEAFVSHATQTSQGTKMSRANWDVLTKYPLPLPPVLLLSQFSASLNDAVALIQNLIFKNRNLRRTRDLLLPKLMSGALDVSKLDIETA
jgi:type I restriction enzyme S subunit